MGANADPNENKSKMLVFLKRGCIFVYVHAHRSSANLLILREGGLVYQIVVEQISANYCQS